MGQLKSNSKNVWDSEKAKAHKHYEFSSNLLPIQCLFCPLAQYPSRKHVITNNEIWNTLSYLDTCPKPRYNKGKLWDKIWDN